MGKFAIFLISVLIWNGSETDRISFCPILSDKAFAPEWRTIHVFVALCDNQNQGIVPVPAKIGNGQDPDNNLYWGCGFGIRSYFKKSKEWKFVESRKMEAPVFERLIFKHVSKPFFLVADAYDGKYIRQCTEDFLNSAAGRSKSQITSKGNQIGIEGHSNLVAYIGHDGLMDFDLTAANFGNTDKKQRDAIVLACYSKNYFAPHLRAAKADPLVWTTHLMCPEAYTLHDALSGYVLEESNEQIRSRAARAYARYQKCGEGAARKLLVTGF